MNVALIQKIINRLHVYHTLAVSEEFWGAALSALCGKSRTSNSGDFSKFE